MSKYFTDAEMACKHCGQGKMNPNFMDYLDIARGLADMPFIITSGYRCPVHNAAVRGDPDNHPKGVAADIACTTGPQRLKMVRALLTAGFHRIGLGPTFVHVDMALGKPDSMFYE
jgi:uncharacterized protein YcbK (DUF882 family)